MTAVWQSSPCFYRRRDGSVRRMPKANKKTLPKDFDELSKAGDAGAIKAVFEGCDVNARGGVWKQTALALNELPDDVAAWLVENGADIAARPVPCRARRYASRGVLQENWMAMAASIGTPSSSRWPTHCLSHLGVGQPLPAPALQEAATLVGEVKRKNGDTRRLCELAVQWVALNPAPIALPAPAYER
ncbi:MULTISPECIES: hypothetical protein [unclassified Achromobacter]|uniref:hypothetical protein n=1 Tax=unclassified Achromobacter TaxID=2626865 RepID=UPI0018E90AFB|nr:MULTISPECIES: hypothetical protein [unclassified Achromobacter]